MNIDDETYLVEGRLVSPARLCGNVKYQRKFIQIHSVYIFNSLPCGVVSEKILFFFLRFILILFSSEQCGRGLNFFKSLIFFQTDFVGNQGPKRINLIVLLLFVLCTLRKCKNKKMNQRLNCQTGSSLLNQIQPFSICCETSLSKELRSIKKSPLPLPLPSGIDLDTFI